MSGDKSTSPAREEGTSCGSLFRRLQKLWDEIGEGDLERDKIILQLEQECLNIYRKKVEQTIKHKAYLHQALAEGEDEVSNIISTLGERESFVRSDKPKGTLKEQVAAISPLLEVLRQKKLERVKEFSDVQLQIAQICGEIAGDMHQGSSASILVDERDLTIKRLENMKVQLQELQRDKAIRLQKVNAHVKSIYELSTVISEDVNEMLCEVHPSFANAASSQPKSISNDTLARLAGTVYSLKQVKKERLQKIQCLGSTLIELWSLMETPMEEQNRFDHVTSLMSLSVDDVWGQGRLALDVIERAETEVARLNILKASKMKELVLKRQNELEEIYRDVHMDVDSDAVKQEALINLVNSGNVDMSQLLSRMDDLIRMAKEQALSRKDILDKVDKWRFASEEENWLEDYERDQNRYSAGRGAHKNLKRAEKARALVSKIPSMVENLTTKIKAWEKEKGMPFLYDKVHLLETLDEYTMFRQQREEDKRRSREQKRLQEQFDTEQEALFGSKPSPLRQLSAKKPLGQISNINTAYMTPTNRRVSTPLGRHGISSGKDRKENRKDSMVIPPNYVALPKDDSSPCNRSAIVPP